MLPIDFVAFSGDCLIRARLTMFGDRLTDMLNAQPRYTLSRVRLDSLDDGHVFEIGSTGNVGILAFRSPSPEAIVCPPPATVRNRGLRL